MTNLEDVSNSITNWVGAATGGTLLGVRLGILLRDKYTDFSPLPTTVGISGSSLHFMFRQLRKPVSLALTLPTPLPAH